MGTGPSDWTTGVSTRASRSGALTFKLGGAGASGVDAGEGQCRQSVKSVQGRHQLEVWNATGGRLLASATPPLRCESLRLHSAIDSSLPGDFGRPCDLLVLASIYIHFE